MKVNTYTHSDLPASKTSANNTPKAEQSAVQTATSTANSAGVSVVITSAARTMGKDALNQASEIDSKKVAAMKAAIQDGSFTVNAEAIADKLLSNAQEMLSTTRK
jgi:negative regulator of flagellin synthesis FlgM